MNFFIDLNFLISEGVIKTINQGIGIGVSYFKKLRLKEYYYIDKSIYIKNIIDNRQK